MRELFQESRWDVMAAQIRETAVEVAGSSQGKEGRERRAKREGRKRDAWNPSVASYWPWRRLKPVTARLLPFQLSPPSPTPLSANSFICSQPQAPSWGLSLNVRSLTLSLFSHRIRINALIFASTIPFLLLSLQAWYAVTSGFRQVVSLIHICSEPSILWSIQPKVIKHVSKKWPEKTLWLYPVYRAF